MSQQLSNYPHLTKQTFVGSREADHMSEQPALPPLSENTKALANSEVACSRLNAIR
jgi:hypothetical protein